ncbi:alpha/beta hydrolase [Candidatus Micrarchaeota archaeon]|nr:alpha/beta hydrolase [Candidatus Micrarchaeota archaeon]
MQKIFLNSKTGKICCLYNKLNADSIVILAHGYLSNKNSTTNKRLVELLNEKGISTIAFDMYGHGESDGDVEHLTITKAVENLLTVYDFVKSEDYEKIGVAGSSFTGIVSLIAASKREFTVVSLKCPVFDSKKLWDDRFGRTGVEKWKEEGFITPFGKKWHFEAYEDASKYNMEKITSEIKAPTLVVHGNKDVTVPLSHAKGIISALSSEKKLVVVEGANHFFEDEKHFKEMINASFEWLILHVRR